MISFSFSFLLEANHSIGSCSSNERRRIIDSDSWTLLIFFVIERWKKRSRFSGKIAAWFDFQLNFPAVYDVLTRQEDDGDESSWQHSFRWNLVKSTSVRHSARNKRFQGSYQLLEHRRSHVSTRILYTKWTTICLIWNAKPQGLRSRASQRAADQTQARQHGLLKIRPKKVDGAKWCCCFDTLFADDHRRTIKRDLFFLFVPFDDQSERVSSIRSTNTKTNSLP